MRTIASAAALAPFASFVLTGASLLSAQTASAQDAQPASAQDPAGAHDTEPPAAAPAQRPAVVGASPVVSAGVVNTNHVDTVVVAESGSHVSVHDRGSRDRRYREDPARTAAVIASPIAFGLGALVSGVAYLSEKGSQTCVYPTPPNQPSCTSNNAVGALAFYDSIVAITPSVPRWVVGDYNGALIYTGIRGASVLVASLVSWGSGPDDWLGPFTFGMLLPVTLGIVDLATTPHREDLERRDAPASESRAAPPAGPSIAAVAPAAVTDSERRVRGAMIGMSGTF